MMMKMEVGKIAMIYLIKTQKVREMTLDLEAKVKK